MKLITKMVSVGALMVSLVAALVLLGVSSMSSIGDNVDTIVRQNIPFLSSIHNLSKSQLEQFVWLERAMLASKIGNNKNFDAAAYDFDKLSKSISAQYDKSLSLIGLIANSATDKQSARQALDIKKQLAVIKSDYSLFTASANTLFESMRKSGSYNNVLRMSLVEKHIEMMIQKLQSINTAVETKVAVTAKDALYRNSVSTNTMIITSLFAFVIALVSGFFIVRSIKKQPETLLMGYVRRQDRRKHPLLKRYLQAILTSNVTHQQWVFTAH